MHNSLITRHFLLVLLFFTAFTKAQTNKYYISFENAVHHEAQVQLTVSHIKSKTVTARMSRTSPGRYALHEFAKNVYGFKATNSLGESLPVKRPDPYSWEITDHDGTIIITYTLFANRADGTYSQIDESHAHLNIPATFMFVDDFEHRPIEVNFKVRDDLNWKIATQLKKLEDRTYFAPNLQYFMDSPIEISNFALREFNLEGKNIRFALHHPGTDAEFDQYWEQVKAIVKAEKDVYGELPDFDYGTYTFLACYLPHVSGDGMEHRNSTILTDQEPLGEGGMRGNIGTVSHEFFHAWNVERIRPAGLEPFDFKEVNMSEALWFAEGFTSYYTNLILCRAQIITPQEYISGLEGSFNYVWNSPARKYYNPIEMSYQAPFVDAARSVDPVNRENTFISYYSYGSVLGLALDLSLRKEGLNLDDFMKMVWQKFGKNERSYSIKDLENTLMSYAGNAFAKAFFNDFIYSSKMPNYDQLFAHVGVDLIQNSTDISLGIAVREVDSGIEITRNIAAGTAAYQAGLDQGDVLININDTALNTIDNYQTLLHTFNVGDKLEIKYLRFGVEAKTSLTIDKNLKYSIKIDDTASRVEEKARRDWLLQ